MPSGSNIATTIVCPLIGCLICNVMWLTPLFAIQVAKRLHKIGDINPIPFTITIANCIGWTTYGIMKHDYFIFLSNCTGLVLGFYYTVTSMAILFYEIHLYDNNSEKSKRCRALYGMLEILMFGGIIFWIGIGLIIGLGNNIDNTNAIAINMQAIGLIGCCFGLSYYAAPLTTLVEVVKNKDSSSLYKPTLFANLINATMWVIYGLLGTGDPLVWGPNLIGFILSILQLSLAYYYPSKDNGNNNSIISDNNNSIIGIEQVHIDHNKMHNDEV